MRRFRTLYFKIFGWFWLTAAAGSAMVLLLTFFSGSQPLGYRWMHVTQDLYAHSAMDFYVTGGKPALAKYIDALQTSSSMEARLLKGDADVLGYAPLPDVGHVLEQSKGTGHSAVRLGRVWTACSPLSRDGAMYYFVVEVHPLRGFMDGTFAGPMAFRLLIALLVAGACCLVLARNLVAPIRALQVAAMRLAAGDLSTRVMPAIAPRDDELAETARAFDLMADRMQLLIQKRQELLADISHELRSPLTRLSISLELLRRGELDVVEQMQVDLDKMNEMIGQVLLLTRLDMKEATPLREKIDLCGMLESLAEDAGFEGAAEGKSVVVSSPVECVVLGDANLLRSCFENVVRNAVHYTRVGTAVEIVVRRVEGWWVVEVRDRGPGVPDEVLGRLFEPFYRVSASRDRKEGGTGLGLSIAQRVMLLHGGDVVAENGKGGGLCVRLRLPVA